MFTDSKSALIDEDLLDDQVSNYTQSTNDCSRILEMLAPDNKFDFLDDSTDEKQSDEASVPETSTSVIIIDSADINTSISSKPVKVIELNLMRELTHQNANE